MIPLKFLGVSAGQRTMIIAIIVLLGVYLVLERMDAFDWNLYIFFTLVVVALSINAMGFNLVGWLIASPAFPILAIGAVILGYLAIQAYRESNTTIVEVAGDRIRRS